MSEKAYEDKQSTSWLLILFAIIVAILLYLISKFRIQDANEKLLNHLHDKKDALAEIEVRIEYYRKEKIQLAYAKKKTAGFIRCSLAIILLSLNGLYLWKCHPNNITLQAIFECIATFNAALLFLIGIFVFAVYGSFFEVKSVYHSIQTLALTFLFKENEETINAVLNLDLEHREVLRIEITETERAIKQNSELLPAVELITDDLKRHQPQSKY